MKARVVVTLKTGVLDPQGKAIEGALASLGVVGIGSVRQGKVFDLTLTGDREGAEATVRQACEKLLANTVIENFSFEIEGGAMPLAEAEESEDPPAMPDEGHP